MIACQRPEGLVKDSETPQTLLIWDLHSIQCQRPLSSCPQQRQGHFPGSASLILLIVKIPSPPSLIGRHIWLRPTKWNFHDLANNSTEKKQTDRQQIRILCPMEPWHHLWEHSQFHSSMCAIRDATKVWEQLARIVDVNGHFNQVGAKKRVMSTILIIKALSHPLSTVSWVLLSPFPHGTLHLQNFNSLYRSCFCFWSY